jgi:PAS domain S-box-containing protein
MSTTGKIGARRSGGRILVVEDQGIVATDIERCLEDSGFEVTAIATCMEDAIQQASACRPDLVLMDIRIHGEVDGIDTADQLRRRFGSPIVYLTAHDDRDTMERARRTQPMAFLIKPFKPAELTSTVEIALARSRADEEMRERERSFLLAMDAIGDAVLTADSEGGVRFMNRAAEELTGRQQESALGCKVTDVLHIVNEPEAAEERFWAFINGDPDSESDSSGEYRVLGSGGVCHWLVVKATTITGTGDNSVRVIVMQDVTRHKQNEQALRRQAGLLDQSQDAIFTWESNGTISHWSLGAQALYGFSPAEALGRAVGELLPIAPIEKRSMDVALQRDHRWSGELRRETRSGREIVVECLLVVVDDETGKTTVLETDRDITERKRAELEILRLNHELTARVGDLTALNQDLDSFNYTISHDLRAPLRHIDAYTKLLIEKVGPDLRAESRNYLERVCGSARRLGRMVDELLELSRTSRMAPARQLTALKPLIEDVLFEFKPDLQGREIEWGIGELSDAHCDPTLTRQVFANLLANAIKFTLPRKPAVIEIGQLMLGEERVIFMRDNGVGFSMKYAHKLFGVFQRLHPREDFEGTGIGLVTVRRIVEKHGGRVWAEAELDRGATFFFTLEPPRFSQTSETTVAAGAREC